MFMSHVHRIMTNHKFDRVPTSPNSNHILCHFMTLIYLALNLAVIKSKSHQKIGQLFSFYTEHGAVETDLFREKDLFPCLLYKKIN